jgi:hypothetical protein
MQQPPPKLSWVEIILLALFPLGFILAAAGSGRTMLEAFAARGAFAVVIFIAWLQQLTFRRQPAPLWASAVLLAFVLALLAFLLWQHIQDSGS